MHVNLLLTDRHLPNVALLSQLNIDVQKFDNSIRKVLGTRLTITDSTVYNAIPSSAQVESV